MHSSTGTCHRQLTLWLAGCRDPGTSSSRARVTSTTYLLFSKTNLPQGWVPPQPLYCCAVLSLRAVSSLEHGETCDDRHF